MKIGTDEAKSGELDLVLRAQSGEPEAFGALVRQYQRRAVSVAYRLLGNAEDASDVAQDAFVRAYRSLAQLDDPARFGGWLMRVVCNLSLNFRRSRANRPTVSWESEAEPTSGEGPTGESRPATQELNAAIEQALSKLPDQQRLALVLFSVEGLPQKEVAQILECSVELVKWNVFQARKQLKEQLALYL